MEYVFRVMLTDEAVDFLSSMPAQARDKMNGNISRAAKGERNTEIFKKLQNSEIWDARNTEESHTACFHFGTQMRRRW